MQAAFGRRSENTRHIANGAAAKSVSGENRFAPRRESAMPALISFDDMADAMPCLIRDMSTTGAKVELRPHTSDAIATDFSGADRVRLVVRADRVIYECKIVRRSDRELGLAFVAAPKPMLKTRR